MVRGTLSTESLIGVLLLIIIVTLFYAFLSSIANSFVDSLQQASLHDRASSTSLLASVYSYSLKHGYFNPQLNCSVGANISCKDDFDHTAIVNAYRRRGGGD